MLVGKKATIDGSTIIARDEDGESGINQKTFKVFPARDYDEEFISEYSGVRIPLHGHGCRFTATPNAQENEIKGRWDEQGINEYNVAMSATETEGTNARCLGHDPLVKNGIDEDSMLYLVLPFIKTAREGVARLGKLIEQYGTGECNGIAFADQDGIGAAYWSVNYTAANSSSIASYLTINWLPLHEIGHGYEVPASDMYIIDSFNNIYGTLYQSQFNSNFTTGSWIFGTSRDSIVQSVVDSVLTKKQSWADLGYRERLVLWMNLAYNLKGTDAFKYFNIDHRTNAVAGKTVNQIARTGSASMLSTISLT